MRPLVFLTYSFKDIHRARRLRDSLRRYGIDVWPDKTLTPGTPSWKMDVQQQLAEAVCIIAILSQDSNLSGWVQQAVDAARTYQIPVIPALMDGDPAHPLLIELDGEDWFDLRWSWNYPREIREMVFLIRQLATAETVGMLV